MRPDCRIPDDEGGEFGGTHGGEAPQLRDDVGIDDVLDMAAAIAWVGGQPTRDSAQRARLLRVLIDGLRPRID